MLGKAGSNTLYFFGMTQKALSEIMHGLTKMRNESTQKVGNQKAKSLGIIWHFMEMLLEWTPMINNDSWFFYKRSAEKNPVESLLKSCIQE